MNTNIFGNFATKFFVFVLMLIAGVSTLAALATAHEVTVTVSEVKIWYEGVFLTGYSGARDVVKDEILAEAGDQIWFKVTFSESVILDPGVKIATTASSGSRIPHLEIVNADGTAWTTNATAQTEFYFRTGSMTNRGTQLQIRENALYGISSNQGKIKDSSGTALTYSTSHAVVKDAGALASGTSTAPFVADSDNGQSSTPWTIPISWGSTSRTTVTVSEVKIWYDGTTTRGYSGARDVRKNTILGEASDRIWFKVTFSESVILDPGVKFATTASSGSGIPELEIVNADGTAWTTNATAQTEFHFRTGGITSSGTHLQIRENALYGISSNQGKIKNSSGTALTLSTTDAVVQDAGALASGTSTAPFVAASDNGKTSTPWTIPIGWDGTPAITVTVNEVKIRDVDATTVGYSGARDVIKDEILKAGDQIWFKVTFSDDVVLEPGVKFATTAPTGSRSPELEIVRANGAAWTTNADEQTQFHFRYTVSTTSRGTQLKIQENALYGISSNQGKIRNSSGTALTLSTPDAVVQDAGALASGTSTAPFVAASDNGKTSTPWTIPIGWDGTPSIPVTVNEVKIRDVDATTVGYSGTRDVIKNEILETGDEIWFKVTFSESVILEPGVKFSGLIRNPDDPSTVVRLALVRANGAAWTTNATAQTEFHFLHTVLPSDLYSGTRLEIWDYALHVTSNQGKIKNSSGTAFALSKPVVQDAGALASGTSTAPFVAASDDGQPSTPWTIPIRINSAPSITVTVNEVKVWEVATTTRGYSGARDVIKNERLEAGDEVWFKVTFSDNVILDPGVKFSGLITHPADGIASEVHLALVRANGAAWTTNESAQTEFHFLHTVRTGDLGDWLQFRENALRIPSNQGKIKNSSGTAFALSKLVVKDAGALASGKSTAPFVPTSDNGQGFTPWTIPIGWDGTPRITVTVSEVKIWEPATTTRGYSGARDVVKDKILKAGDKIWFKVTFSDNVILDPGVKFATTASSGSGIPELEIVNADGTDWATNATAQTEFHFRTGGITSSGTHLQIRENALYGISSNQGKIKNSSGTALTLSTPNAVVQDAGALASGTSTAPFVAASDNGKTSTPWTIPISWGGRASRTDVQEITVTVNEVKIRELATTTLGYSGARDVIKNEILKTEDEIWFKVTFSESVILEPGVKFSGLIRNPDDPSTVVRLALVRANGAAWTTNESAQTEFHFLHTVLPSDLYSGTSLQIWDYALHVISNQGKIKNSSGTAFALSTLVVKDAGALASGTSTAPFVAASDDGQPSTPWIIPIRINSTPRIPVTVSEVKIRDRDVEVTTLGYSGARDVIKDEILETGDEVWFKVTFSDNVILDPGVKFATTASSGSRNPRLEIVKADGTPWTTNNSAQTVFHFRYTVSADSATSLGTHLKFSNDALFAVRSNHDKIKNSEGSALDLAWPDGKILDAGALASGSTDPPFVAASDNGQGSTPWVIPISMDGGTPAFQATTGIARVPVDANGVPNDPNHDIVYGLASDTVVLVNQEEQGPAVAGEPFTVYIAFLFGDSLHPTDVLIASDIKVMSGGKEVSNAVSNVRYYGMWGRDTTAPQAAVYLATITPPLDSNGYVVITVPEKKVQDIAGNWNMESNTLTVPVIGTTTLLQLPTDFVQALPSGALVSKGFVVIAHAGTAMSQIGLTGYFKTLMGLPNLETLLTGNGGALELVDTARSVTPGPIITEIMWGTDLSQIDTKSSQWIEIYNAGADIADLSKYQLKITPFSASTFEPDDNAVDTVGNLGNGRWDVPGQSGRSQAQAATIAGPAYPAEALISMSRKIDFAKATVDSGALKDVNDGTLAESWEASTPPARGIGANRIASPGVAHAMQITSADQTSIPYSPIIINEIGNNTGDANDWIELRNVSDAEVNLKKWELNVIVPDGADADSDPDENGLVSFPDKDYKLGAGKILLIVNKDPLETPLARGKKFGDADGMTTVEAHQGQGSIRTGAMYYDAKGWLNALPESGKFLLVLRNTNNKETSHENIIDITGTFFHPDMSRATRIWPLLATPEGHGDVIDGVPHEEFKAPFVYERKKADSGFGEHAWGLRGYTGIGYDLAADNTGVHGGTPGFPNDSLKEKPGDVSDSTSISISEIMVASNDGRYPQWIELRNSSPTQGINLDAWRLRIRNVGEVDSRRNVTIDLPDGFRLPPNQTMLIATRRGAATPSLTSHRVMILWNDITARNALEVQHARYTMLSTEGFTLELFGEEQPLTGTPVDAVTIGAKLLTAENIGDSQQRISLIRYYPDGIAGNWGSAKDSAQLGRIPHETYYGASDDISTPGFYPGSASPVTLSSFLPKRTDAGVVIRWTTQSELNNAGFNILRSATKTGEFVVINPTMIQGAGTTGEKHTYGYTDKTAKPNLVYYYQIEDVSFDGNRQRLTDATRLRGHIGAAGKLPTTWGGLKVRD